MPGRIRVEVVRARPRRHVSQALELPVGATVADAMAVVGPLAEDEVGVAIHGEKVDPTHPLRDGDRLELLRPLLIDPKEARRRRARK
jgi:hypothetical protein